MRDFQENDTSYVSAVRELIAGGRELINNEIHLLKEEGKLAARRVASHSAQAALFGALLALSIFPFLAFLVIGLGAWLGGNYWLSSLIVALVCAVIGGGFAYRAFRKITGSDLEFPASRRTLRREAEFLASNVSKAQNFQKRRPA